MDGPLKMAPRRGKDERGPEAAEPWYGEGLRFECRPDCAACCVNHGTHTYVYLEGDDAERLAQHLKLDRELFHSRYTKHEDGNTLLRMEDPDCIFLEGKRCGVYEARPTQCRTFPFWPENMKSPERWSALRSFCPGIDQGPLNEHSFIARNLRIMDVND